MVGGKRLASGNRRWPDDECAMQTVSFARERLLRSSRIAIGVFIMSPQE